VTAEDGSTTPTPTRAEAIVEFLKGEGVNYELIEHEPTMSGADEARTMHESPDRVAKTIGPPRPERVRDRRDSRLPAARPA
jgi:hypothetical protein